MANTERHLLNGTAMALGLILGMQVSKRLTHKPVVGLLASGGMIAVALYIARPASLYLGAGHSNPQGLILDALGGMLVVMGATLFTDMAATLWKSRHAHRKIAT